MSRIVSVQKLEKLKETYTIKATSDEKKALAERLGIVSLDEFEASFKIQWRGGSALNHDVYGALQAKVTQQCVVSQKHVFEIIQEEFYFRIAHSSMEEALQENLDAFEDIELCEVDEIDIGEIATQYLILALNPYPRFEDVSIPLDQTESKHRSPFLILEHLKKTDDA